MSKHAVLYYPDRPFPNTSLLWIEGNGFRNEELPDPCYTAEQVAEVALKRDITHVWIMPIYGEITVNASHDEWTIKEYQRKRKTALVSVWKRGAGRQNVSIIFPQHTAWWGTEKQPGWMYEVSPHDLLITLRYLEQVLSVTIASSPGRAGWDFLKTIHPEWVELIPDMDWKAAHFTSAAAPDIIWQRGVLPSEQSKLYLHKFDENASYPYAASQTDIGVGKPVYKDHGNDMDDTLTTKGTTRQSQAVGVWRVTVEIMPQVGLLNMPTIWHKYEGWLAGPIIRLLRKAGGKVTVHEGYVFPERHDVLAKWAKKLWEIRKDFSTEGKWKSVSGARLAARAVKQIMNSTIGMTAFRGFEEDDEMRRPDIRLQTIARHSELTWHRIDKIRTIHSVTPVIVYMDALYYLSDEPDGRKAFPELVAREKEMGGYKYEGHIAMHDALPILDSRLSEGEKLEQLNKIGWEQ